MSNRRFAVLVVLIALVVTGAVWWSFGPDGEPMAAGETVYITNTGECYHRSGCECLSRSKIAIAKENATRRGYRPCSKCNP